jgi:uncharacterized protein (DUF58 family)
MRLRPRKRFYLIVALMVVDVVTALATGVGIFYRLLYIMAITTAVSFLWTWLSLKALEVTVERRSRRVRVGDPLEEWITARNLSSLPRPAVVVEDQSDIPGFTTGMAVNLGPKGSRTWNATGHARKRGVYTLGPARISCSDPFGLFRGEHVREGTEPLIVYPRIHEVVQFTVPAAYLSGESSLKKRTHDLTPHASSVRDYAHGDSLGRVHWNSTARLGKLMSKEFDEGHSSDVWIVIDLHRDTQAGKLEDSTDEYAVSIGASLAKRFLALGLPVGLIVYADQKYLLPADTGPGQLDRMMEYLARAKAESIVHLDEALAQDEGLWTDHTTLVVITTSPRKNWAMALRELAKRRVKVAAVLLDGRSFGGFFDSMEVMPELDLAGIPTYVVRSGDNISVSLAQLYNASKQNGAVRRELVEAIR